MAKKLEPYKGERRILTLQDQRNAMFVSYKGSRIAFRSIHLWDDSRQYIEVELDRAVVRELALELWRAAGQCDALATRYGITRHKEGMTPVDKETWDFCTQTGIPPEYLWDEPDEVEGEAK